MRLGLSVIALVLVGWSSCAPAEPAPELMIRNRWIGATDRRVVRYACPEALRRTLYAADPLRAAADFVRHGNNLEVLGTNLIDPFSQTPESIAIPLDSLRSALQHMGCGFTIATGLASIYVRECYGVFPLNCNKLTHARNVRSRVDEAAIRAGFREYLRQHAILDEIFEEENAPLQPARTCPERP